MPILNRIVEQRAALTKVRNSDPFEKLFAVDSNNQKTSNLTNEYLSAMNNQKRELHYSFRLYLNTRDKRVLGKGGAQILNAIDQLGSISAAAKELHMSYRFVWNYITRMEERLGKSVIVTRRGGTRHGKRKGGGGTQLTHAAKVILDNYTTTEAQLQKYFSSAKRKRVSAHS